MNFCFDLDGPIIDVTDRYYRAYLESLAGNATNPDQILPKEDFWKLKQNRITDLELGIMSSLSISNSINAAETRKGLSFKSEYLSLDKLFDDVYKTFEYLKSQKITFFVVTLRRKKQLVHAIKQFKLNEYLTSDRFFSLADEEKIINDIQSKHLLLVGAINKLRLEPRETWIVGDSDTDIHAGRLARLGKTIAISRGIRSKEQLEILNPDYLVNNLNELMAIIQKLPV